jgi:hypothetical protein
LGICGADIVEERSVYFVGEEGEGRFTGDVDQCLKCVPGDYGASRILGVAVRDI